jgi:tRNA G18 (ribose-2'-O)-methylase SpoU
VPPDHFFIAGLNGVRECLRSPHVAVRRLFSCGPLPEELQSLAGSIPLVEGDSPTCPYGELVQRVAALVRCPCWPSFEDWLDQQSGGVRPTGVRPTGVRPTGVRPLLLLLDQLHDPQNFGQIIRSAECAGVQAIVLSEHRSVSLTQVAAQVSQGAFAWQTVLTVTNLRQAMEKLKRSGFWVIGCEALPEARPWFQVDFCDPCALVLGSEGFGLRESVRKACDHLIRLPLAGHISSLNVSAAAAAVLFEAARQRAAQRGFPS